MRPVRLTSTLILTFAACAALLGVWSCVPLGGSSAEHPHGETLGDLLDRLALSHSRRDQLAMRQEALMACVEGKERVTREVIAGRTDLLRAAAAFRDLQARIPDYDWELFRQAYPAPSEEESLCLAVIASRPRHARRPPRPEGCPVDPLAGAAPAPQGGRQAAPAGSVHHPENLFTNPLREPTMEPTRRELMRLGLGGATLLACGATVPTFLARSAAALTEPAPRRGGRVLVVLQLDGGNDGLNTVVPHRDDVYRRSRPRLALPAQGLHRLNDDLGMHPALVGLMRLHENRQLAVVQSVGYPNPNRSHFESMAIWHTARLSPNRSTPGWLARCLDRRNDPPGGDTPALHISEALLPQALHGSQRHVPSLASLEQFRRRLGIPEGDGAREQRAALDQLGARQRGADGSLLQFVERSNLITYTSSARLEAASRQGQGATGYPEFYGLARRLRLVAQLIKAGLGTSIYYTQIGGFDTHANQLNSHSGLLREVGDSVRAFFEDLRRAGQADRVLLLAFTEFGRRLAENASGGTDHGTAAPVFLVGPRVRPGVHGPNPNLRELTDGDPRHALDFRRIYATVLDQWLACPSAAVLGGAYEHLAVLQPQQPARPAAQGA
jgi:uncharacterized protein (DUF1501 family)